MKTIRSTCKSCILRLPGLGELFLSDCTKRFVSSSPKNYCGNTNKNHWEWKCFKSIYQLNSTKTKGKSAKRICENIFQILSVCGVFSVSQQNVHKNDLFLWFSKWNCLTSMSPIATFCLISVVKATALTIARGHFGPRKYCFCFLGIFWKL